MGTDQIEGVHCEQSDCRIENVWWDNVCEDALTIKGGSASSVTSVIGGGARFAEDKVIQHNGLGAVSIEGFYVQDFGKLYRSCGMCGRKSRNVTVRNVYAVDGTCSIVTVNKNLNDQATIENIKIKGEKVNVSDDEAARETVKKSAIDRLQIPNVISTQTNSPCQNIVWDHDHFRGQTSDSMDAAYAVLDAACRVKGFLLKKGRGFAGKKGNLLRRYKCVRADEYKSRVKEEARQRQTSTRRCD
ncbi:hypothetical protein PsorP6_009704 [Peronosclerospora sorghi]|uniref:Uncharacterized protein n=1 Tax=Peronosclerospora sorghi TaxID=230839 RepID=A0ACC0W0D3_9STRA|nr:hypothetical protein PsorP6_009704 [Peronosclerospora sorghi]